MSRDQIEKQAIEELTAFLWKNTLIHTEDLCHDVAETVIKEGYRKQSEWISVDERLPTDRELVLVSSMDLLTQKHGWFYLARYTDLQNDGVIFDNKRWLSENGGIFGKVTHWMPLPEPPKGE